jgi:hypothetical protein
MGSSSCDWHSHEHPRAIRYRRLALVEQDNEKAQLLRRIADETDRGILFTAEHSLHDKSIRSSRATARMTEVGRKPIFGKPVAGKPENDGYRCELCGTWIE